MHDTIIPFPRVLEDTVTNKEETKRHSDKAIKSPAAQCVEHISGNKQDANVGRDAREDQLGAT